jgi:hypothetical protein
MGLDINIVSLPRATSDCVTEFTPSQEQVGYARNNWTLLGVLAHIHKKRGGESGSFNDASLRIYKRDLKALPEHLHEPILEHLGKARVVYAVCSY